MNVQLLIDSVVRQTTVLIAQLATAGGARAPLARIAHQVFADLAGELEAQGLSRKVTADMFGISLRSYQRKVHRARDSRTEQGTSLWESVYDFLASRPLVRRDEVLSRFRRDEPASVRGILHDLVNSGLVFVTGNGDDAIYRTASQKELEAVANDRSADTLLWAVIYREGPLTRAQLAERVALEPPALADALSRLEAGGHVKVEERAPEPLYRSEQLVLPRDASHGWEAAVYDHFHAVVKTVCARLDADTAREGYREYIGGSTYSLDVSRSHPLRQEALSTLARLRAELGDLRARVNAGRTDDSPRERVVVYMGQCVLPQDDGSEGGAEWAANGDDEAPEEGGET